MKLTLSAKRLTERRQGLGRGGKEHQKSSSWATEELTRGLSPRWIYWWEQYHSVVYRCLTHRTAGVSSTWFRYIAVTHQETLSTIP